jgi:hypothetical protein
VALAQGGQDHGTPERATQRGAERLNHGVGASFTGISWMGSLSSIWMV